MIEKYKVIFRSGDDTFEVEVGITGFHNWHDVNDAAVNQANQDLSEKEHVTVDDILMIERLK